MTGRRKEETAHRKFMDIVKEVHAEGLYSALTVLMKGKLKLRNNFGRLIFTTNEPTQGSVYILNSFHNFTREIKKKVTCGEDYFNSTLTALFFFCLPSSLLSLLQKPASEL